MNCHSVSAAGKGGQRSPQRSEGTEAKNLADATLWLTPRLTAIGKPLAPKGALRKRVYISLRYIQHDKTEFILQISNANIKSVEVDTPLPKG
ncbi:MAG: hypothetical protein HC862_20965 [Scytonema sp. RU_4_4]|nr:hypothetical protein [Scytonema sp. RU_4_4]